MQNSEKGSLNSIKFIHYKRKFHELFGVKPRTLKNRRIVLVSHFFLSCCNITMAKSSALSAENLNSANIFDAKNFLIDKKYLFKSESQSFYIFLRLWCNIRFDYYFKNVLIASKDLLYSNEREMWQ